MAYTVDMKDNGESGKVTKSETRLSKIVPKPAPTWPLPHGEGQGPRPNPNIPNKVNAA